MPLQLPIFGWFYWNPDRVLFTLPWIDHPVVWYGLWFVTGFICGYFILIPLFQRQLQSGSRAVAQTLVDRLTWYMVIGTLIGARIGHVFLYDWPYYETRPAEIIKVWKGGLASHGAAIGILVSLYLYLISIRKQFPEFTFLRLLDLIVIPTPLVGAFIRIGNFFNQEIIGTPSTLPWAVLFGDPIGSELSVPRHPVQLYEAFAYLLLFAFLLILWKRNKNLPVGLLSGLFLVILFASRFLIEFYKAPQSLMMDESYLQAGQFFSLPFIFIGILLCFYAKMKKKVSIRK